MCRSRIAAVLPFALLTAACTGGTTSSRLTTAPSHVATATPSRSPTTTPPTSAAATSRASVTVTTAHRRTNLLSGMPPSLSPSNVYAADRAGNISSTARNDRALVYVPDTKSNDVYVIDQRSMRVVDIFPGGHEPQHVVPSYDLKTLYVAADYVPGGGSLTPINPRTGKPGKAFAVPDPYNLYFTPNGKYGIVVAEEYRRLDFYDPHTWRIRHQLRIPACAGIDHMDFSADGRLALASCEFADRMVVIDVARQRLIRTIRLPGGANGMPQDVKLSPDGSVFYVADMIANGVYLIDGHATHVIGFVPTGRGAHGLYIDRSATRLFVTNRDESSISVIDLATRRPATKWRIPGGGSPDMGNISADGRVLWLSGRYDNVVYAINTRDGHLIKEIPVGSGPHGLCVWPQPGRYSLGHTGILR